MFEKLKKLKFKALWEGVKFAIRMAVFALPIIITALTDLGLTKWAVMLSGVLAFIDKIIHEAEKIKLNGLLWF